MAVKLLFDPTALPSGWFDHTGTPPGWLDVDLGDDGGGGTTVSPPKLASTSVLRAHTVTVNTIPVTAPKIASTSVLRTPTIQIRVVAPKLASTSVLRTPTVALQIAAPKLASTSVLRAHVVQLTVFPAKLASTSVLRAHTVTVGADIVVEPPKLASTSVLRAHSVSLSVTAPKLASTSVLRVHTVAPQITITPPKLASTSVLRDHTVISGTTLLPPKLDSTSVLRAHSVTLSITLGAPKLASTSTLYPPTVQAGQVGGYPWYYDENGRKKRKKRIIPAFETAPLLDPASPPRGEDGAEARAADRGDPPTSRHARRPAASIARALLEGLPDQPAIEPVRTARPWLDAFEIDAAIEAKRLEDERAAQLQLAEALLETGMNEAFRAAQLAEIERLEAEFHATRRKREEDEDRIVLLAALEMLF